MSDRAFFSVSVGGTDITGNLSRHLISLTISDNEGTIRAHRGALV